MPGLSDDDRRLILEEIIEHLEDASRLLRELDDNRLSAYCLADLEGQTGGWLGYFVRDHLNEALHAINAGDREA
jgi:hypothetical protein